MVRPLHAPQQGTETELVPGTVRPSWFLGQSDPAGPLDGQTALKNWTTKRKSFYCSRKSWIVIFVLPVALWPNAGYGLLIHDVSSLHTTTHQSVGVLWTRNQLNAETSTWQHSTNERRQTDIHASGAIRTHNLSRRAAADIRLRPRGHWDQL